MPTFNAMMLFWYMFPFVIYLLSSIITKKMGLYTRYGIKAPDISIPFFLIGIYYVSVGTFDESFLPYVFLMIFLVGMIVAVFQTYHFKEINYRRYFKMFWRIIFLVTLLVYILLIIVSIIMFLR